ncbi:hypothetical protein ACFXPI_00335 [Streptomyces sp. NPDC059104]|uniref:hypothetical protein n=1 Tax=Streptomyces sp. NPDC059104 TaxID=3346729 RepID=UPI003691F064
MIAAAKRAIVADDMTEGLLREHDAWAGQIIRPAAERLIRGGPAHGAQTRDGEHDLEDLLRGLAGSRRTARSRRAVTTLPVVEGPGAISDPGT